MRVAGVLLLLLFASCCKAWVLPQHRHLDRVMLGGLRATGVVTEILTTADFERITQEAAATDVIVIDFQRSNCKPCIKTKPEYQALAEKFHDKAFFYNVDADTGKDSLEVLKNNGIRSVPTFHVWRRGKRVDSVQGAHVDELETIIMNEINIIENAGVRQPNEI